MIDLRRALAISVKTSVDEEDLLWLARAAQNCGAILELGSFHGRTALAMLDSSRAHLWCVDAWHCPGFPGYFTEKDYQIFLKNTDCVRDRITVLKMLTQDAAGQLPADFFDLVFIDADHRYEGIKFDIVHYAPKVKPGGLLCGHDYNKNWPGVVQAVRELLTAPQAGGKALWWTRREQGWLFTRL